MMIIIGLAAVLALLLIPILKVLFFLAKGRWCGVKSKGGREQYYRMDDQPQTQSKLTLADRLQVEYFEGGGFSISGLTVAPGCHRILTIMALVFLGGGALLTALSLQDSRDPQQIQREYERQVAGPLVVCIGLLMLAIGIFLSAVNSSRRSAYGSSLPLEPHTGEAGEQGFFSISSRPTTPMANDGQTGRLAKTIGQMDSAHHPSGQTQMDSAAPNVETVGAGNQPSFLSVTRLLLSKHIKGRSKAVRQRGSSEQRHCLLSRLTLFNQADTDMKK